MFCCFLVAFSTIFELPVRPSPDNYSFSGPIMTACMVVPVPLSDYSIATSCILVLKKSHCHTHQVLIHRWLLLAKGTASFQPVGANLQGDV